MTQAISKQNELKQTLAHDKINQDTAIIKEIESIFITTVIDYYKINMDKRKLKRSNLCILLLKNNYILNLKE